jgi:hypothetical protein
LGILCPRVAGGLFQALAQMKCAVSMILGVEPTSGLSEADVRAGSTLNGVEVGLLCGMIVVDGMPPPADNSGACLIVQGMEEGDIIAKMRTGVVPVLTEVQEDALKVAERMEVAEHVEIAVGAQLINNFAYELSADLALPSNGGNRSQGILLEAAMICRCDLELLLVAVRGTTDVNTTIRVLLRPMPCNNVVDVGHLIDGGENGGK